MTIVFESILWVIFGIIIYHRKIVSSHVPTLLGKALYWIGVPIQIFALARTSNFEKIVWVPVAVTVLVLFLGLILSLLIIHKSGYQHINSHEKLLLALSSSDSEFSQGRVKQSFLPNIAAAKGSFIISSTLGSTGFIGLTLVPHFIDQTYWSWIALYGITHNILGSNGLGVLIATRYGYPRKQDNWWNQAKRIIFLPAPWAFAFGYWSQNLSFSSSMDTEISRGVSFVLPGAFILIGMQLRHVRNWHNLKTGFFSTLIKMVVVPIVTGLTLTMFGLEGDSRLVLVLMSGLPTAFSSVILAEAYDLDRNVAISSVVLSTLSLPLVIFLWVTLFR